MTSSGSITGKLTISGIVKSFAGLLRNNGVARFKTQSNLTDYLDVINLTEFESYLGALSFTLSGGQITGSLSEQHGGNVLSTITADKIVTTLAGSPLLNQTTKGYYTVAVLSKAQSPSVATNLYPQGDGAASLTVLTSGKATLKGYLADGTAFTAAGSLTAAKSRCTHRSTVNGSITGVLQFNLADTDTDVEGADLLWIRPARSRARYYTAGWPTGIVTDVIGTAYNSRPT